MTKLERVGSALKTMGMLFAILVTAPVWIPCFALVVTLLWPFIEQWAEFGKEWEESERRFAESLDGESSPPATQEAT